MSTRESGSYWVKRNSHIRKWAVGFYRDATEDWDVPGSAGFFSDSSFDEIDEKRLPDPDEQEEQMGKQLDEMHKDYLKDAAQTINAANSLFGNK